MAASYHARLAFSLVAALAAASGCAGRSAAIPADATLVGEPRGRMMYLAEVPGTLFIVDARSGGLVFSGKLAYGSRVIFLPEKNQVMLNGGLVEHAQLYRDQPYRLFFAEDR